MTRIAMQTYIDYTCSGVQCCSENLKPESLPLHVLCSCKTQGFRKSRLTGAEVGWDGAVAAGWDACGRDASCRCACCGACCFSAACFLGTAGKAALFSWGKVLSSWGKGLFSWGKGFPLSQAPSDWVWSGGTGGNAVRDRQSRSSGWSAGRCKDGNHRTVHQ